MSYLQSIFLGILQGIAEFLPISSSGHLAVFQHWMGLNETPIIYDILLHVASLLVVFFYFRKLIARLFVVLFRWIGRRSKPEDKKDLFMILAVFLSTAVTFIGYLLLKKLFDVDRVKENLFIVFSLFIFTGLILILQRFVRVSPNENGKITPFQALMVGVGQCFGLFPGISRSGATISAAIFCGVKREEAGQLSFLIAIPAILGSLVFKVADLGKTVGSDGAGAFSLPVLIVGMFAAFVSGMIVFPLLIKVLKKDKLWFFGFYLIPLGIGGILYEWLSK